MAREWYISPCTTCRKKSCRNDCDLFEAWFVMAWDKMCEILRKKWGMEQ